MFALIVVVINALYVLAALIGFRAGIKYERTIRAGCDNSRTPSTTPPSQTR